MQSMAWDPTGSRLAVLFKGTLHVFSVAIFLQFPVSIVVYTCRFSQIHKQATVN